MGDISLKIGKMDDVSHEYSRKNQEYIKIINR